MAKAIATCTCQMCGATFEKTTTKCNRREADNWIEWAQKNITECPSCAGKRLHEEEIQSGLIAKFRLGSPLNEKPTIYAVLFGDTFSIKDELKAIKARWTDDYPAEGFFGSLGLSTQRPLKRWVLCVTENNLETICTKLEELGFTCELPDENTLIAWRTAYASAMQEREAKKSAEHEKSSQIEAQIADEVALLGEKPAYPDNVRALWPDGAKWNGRIYGKKGRYRVYFSGTETPISDEIKELMETTLAARQEWEKKKEEITKKYK